MRGSQPSMARPGTRESHRPMTREPTTDTTAVPSRTSSLHSRITQPLPSMLTKSNNRPTPKTLTHAYMVCGVGREPSQWVKAPPPPHGKIQHMKGAVGQFWLPEILGSSPRLETDNEIARALHSAMRVCIVSLSSSTSPDQIYRHVSPTTSKSARVAVNLIVFTTPLSYNKTLSTRSMVLLYECGQEQMRSVQRPFEISAERLSPTIEILLMRHTGFHTA